MIVSPSPAIAEEAAKILLDVDCINIRPEEPYQLTAGWASPVYIDCRKLISFPAERTRMMELTLETLRQNADVEFDIMAGGETAGIPFSAWLADMADVPMCYIRKKPKGFGRNAQIEGVMPENSEVLLVEDLATDGGSKVNFVNAIRNAGAKCAHTSVVFYYGVFPSAGTGLDDLGVNLHYLTNWEAVLKVVERDGYFKDKDLESVRRFLKDPVTWSGAHGGMDKVS